MGSSFLHRLFKKRKSQPGILGSSGKAGTDIRPRGDVIIRGEVWKARSFKNENIRKGDTIRVMDIKSLLLVVSKKKAE